MDETPIIGLREFRLKTTEVDQPTRVVASKPKIRALGLWIPEGYRIKGTIVKVEEEKRAESDQS